MSFVIKNIELNEYMGHNRDGWYATPKPEKAKVFKTLRYATIDRDVLWSWMRSCEDHQYIGHDSFESWLPCKSESIAVVPFDKETLS